VSDEVLLIKFKAGNVGSYNKQIVFEKSDYIKKLFNDKQNPKDYDNENTTQIEYKTSFNANPFDPSAKNSPNLTPRNDEVSNNTSSFNNSTYTNNLSKTDNDDK